MRRADHWPGLARARTRSPAKIRDVQAYPASAPADVVEAWTAAVEDVGLHGNEVALIWRPGRPRPGAQQAASWPAGRLIEPEFDEDRGFIPAADWANSGPVQGLPRVMVWVERTPEGLAG